MTPLERFHQVSLLGMLAASFLALVTAQVLDAPSLAMAGAALVGRIVLGWARAKFRLPEILTTIAAFLYLGFYPVDYYLISRDFLAATVHLVLFLTALLLLRAKTMRDYALLEIVAFLQILAAAALSQSGWFVVFVALFFLFGFAAVASREMLGQLAGAAQITSAGRLNRRLAALAVAQFLAMVLLGAGFFFFLPRTARAAVELWVPNRFHISGFSNSVTLGQIGEIRQSSAPVMHVRLYNPVPMRDLKWRGATLALFDGRRWYNPPSRGSSPLKIENHLVTLAAAPQLRAGRRVFYDVQASASASDVLFFLGTPELLQIDAGQLERMPGNGFRLAESVEQLRYGARSILPDSAPPDESIPPLAGQDRSLYLQLPRLDLRVTALADGLALGSGPRVKAEAIERYLSTRLKYTTKLPDQVPEDPITNFLFERREGHCEYFASAMALMLRSQGIPSRIVTGYQSGVFNPLTQWYLIRAADAHSWVEAYIPGYGWRAYDPTPSGGAATSPGLLGQLALYADAMEVFWQEWVVGYDQERQLALAGRVSRTRRWQGFRWDRWEVDWRAWWRGIDWRRLVVALVGVAGLVLALLSYPKLRRSWISRRQKQKALSGQAEASDATVLYLHMTELLARQGFERPVWMTPAEFASTDAVRQRAPLVERVTRAYNDLRFGGQADSAGELVALLNELETALRR